MNIEIAIRLKKIGTRLKRIAKGLAPLCAIELFLPCAYHSLQLICWPKKEDAMRTWIMLGVGALMFATVVLPSGVWGATIEEVQADMAKRVAQPNVWGGKLFMGVPFHQSVHTAHITSMKDVCASAGGLRLISEGAAGTDLGPVPEGKEYTVYIFMRDTKGYDLWQYSQNVSIPDCK